MKAFLDELLNRYPVLNDCKEEIQTAEKMMLETYNVGGKILVCGNGGSCSDSDHIVGELMKGFLGKRKMSVDQQETFRNILGADAENLIEKLQCGVPAISLPAQSAILSAFANDVDAELVYSQMVFGYAKNRRSVHRAFHIWKFQKGCNGCKGSQSDGNENGSIDRSKKKFFVQDL